MRFEHGRWWLAAIGMGALATLALLAANPSPFDGAREVELEVRGMT